VLLSRAHVWLGWEGGRHLRGKRGGGDAWREMLSNALIVELKVFTVNRGGPPPYLRGKGMFFGERRGPSVLGGKKSERTQ